MFSLLKATIFLVSILIIFAIIHIQRTYRARKWIRTQLKAGLPMPKHHALLGHLPIVHEAMSNLPDNCAVDVAMANISKKFPNGIFYLDFAPFDKPNIIVTSPDGASQIQKLTQLNKPDYVAGVVDTICGGRNLFTMSGQMGKLWRNIFHRGFSTAYMQTLAPVIARECEVLYKILDDQANSGKVVKVLEPVTKLAIDVIASIGLDSRLGYQEKDGVLSSTMMSQLRWAGFAASMNPWNLLNPIRPLILWYNKRQIHKTIGAEIDNRYVELGLQKGNGSLHARSAISLALQDHAAIQSSEIPTGKVNPSYKASMVSQIMLFLMAGQDTTSATITFCLREVFTKRATLSRLRDEHTRVFGSDLSPQHITTLLEKDQDLLNNLPYTLAVIKETLRLHPPASALRRGEAGVSLVDSAGNHFPTEGCNIWVVHTALHRDARYFVEPDEFIPERWLAEAGDRLYPVNGAWRPFETGQRSCLGRSLAVMTMKIALVMVVRRFEFREAYGEEGKKEGGWSGIEGMNFGDAYPVYGIGLAVLPNGGYPCRIEKRDGLDKA